MYLFMLGHIYIFLSEEQKHLPRTHRNWLTFADLCHHLAQPVRRCLPRMQWWTWSMMWLDCIWIGFTKYIYIIIIIYNCLYIYILHSHTHAHSAYGDIDVCNPKSQTCTFWYVPLIGPWILGCVEAPGDWPEHDQRTSEPYQCAWGQGASECEGSPCNPSARVHKYEKSIGRSLG